MADSLSMKLVEEEIRKAADNLRVAMREANVPIIKKERILNIVETEDFIKLETTDPTSHVSF